jgi:hypothetical protein
MAANIASISDPEEEEKNQIAKVDFQPSVI